MGEERREVGEERRVVVEERSLLELPLEVVEVITCHLDLASSLSLASSCSLLHNLATSSTQWRCLLLRSSPLTLAKVELLTTFLLSSPHLPHLLLQLVTAIHLAHPSTDEDRLAVALGRLRWEEEEEEKEEEMECSGLVVVRRRRIKIKILCFVTKLSELDLRTLVDKINKKQNLPGQFIFSWTLDLT